MAVCSNKALNEKYLLISFFRVGNFF